MYEIQRCDINILLHLLWDLALHWGRFELVVVCTTNPFSTRFPVITVRRDMHVQRVTLPKPAWHLAVKKSQIGSNSEPCYSTQPPMYCSAKFRFLSQYTATCRFVKKWCFLCFVFHHSYFSPKGRGKRDTWHCDQKTALFENSSKTLESPRTQKCPVRLASFGIPVTDSSLLQSHLRRIM